MLVLIASCTKQSEKDPDEIILVKIGDKTISEGTMVRPADRKNLGKVMNVNEEAGS